MFWHVFRYNLKSDLRDRTMVFWTLAFPFILATLFGLAFANLDQTEAFNRIPVAVVDNAAWQQDTQLRTVMQEVSTGKDALFSLRVMSEADALAALNDSSVTGIIAPRAIVSIQAPTAGPAPATGPAPAAGPAQHVPAVTALDLTVAHTGLTQSIIKVFADEYQQTAATYRSLAALDPGVDFAAVQAAAGRSWLKNKPLSQSAPNTTLVYFYALIAMTCLYGGFWGLKEVMQVQADQTPHAARVVTAPVPRLQLILASSAAKMIIHFGSLLAVIAYLRFGLRISFGTSIGHMLLACFLGSLLGVAIGAAIGVALRTSEGVRIGILIGVSMLCSMFGGLNNAEIKYIAVKNAPILAWINPANLIGDAFYALYYYDTYTRYWGNILAMLAFIAVLGAFVALKLRRQRYASI